MKIVVVGGVAAGASMAARARRLNERAEITILERGPDVSFANCGLPYYIGGEITDRARLALQTPESLREMLNVDVRARTEAFRIDRIGKRVHIRDLETGTESALDYDKLVLAPGASPVRPPLPGIDDERIYTLRNLVDMDRIAKAAEQAKRCLVIGGGFIGLEMAEQFVRLGKEVTLVELLEQVLPPLDPEMAQLVENELRSNGVELRLGDGISGFEPGAACVTARLASGAQLQADLVLLSIGVKPDSRLAIDAGLEVGKRGAILVNDWMQTSDPDVYAAGDAVEHRDRVFGRPMNLPLGGPANRQGRLIADHIFLPEEKRLPYPGHLGTSIVRVFDLGAGVTGWNEKQLKEAGMAYETVTVSDFQHASYYPGAIDLTLKITWAKETGRLLGAQAVGADGVDKRIDVLATALAGGMTVDDLAHLELAYAPPFGSARDVVNTAGFAAGNIRNGLLQPAEEPVEPERTTIDVRPAPMAQARPMRSAVNIPLPQLRGRLHEIDPSTPLVTACAKGKMSYFASRILAQHGYDVRSLSGGVMTHPDWAEGMGGGDGGSDRAPGSPSGNGADPAPHARSHSASPPPAASPPVELDATGIACPGPLMRVQQAAASLAAGQELHVRASDAGFVRDIEAYCGSTGMELLSVEKHKGIVHARLRRPATEPASAGAAAVAPAADRKDTTLIVFSEDMDKALAAFVVANGGKAMGGDVTMFFTFWGLNVLRKEHPPKVSGKTFMDKMFGTFMPRGIGALPLSKMHFGGMGTAMMKGRMASKQLPNLPDLLKSAQDAGIRLVACSMSMEAMGIRQEELLDGVEIGGVADMLAAARSSSATLFI